MITALLEQYKAILSMAAVLLTFVGFGPYVMSIIAGQTKPHVFSWVIWCATTLIVFFAQMADGAGVGGWPIGLSALITLGIAILAYLYRGDATITRSDWVFFITALLAIPFWYVMNNPLYAVILLTSIDIIGFAPTLRKAYIRPREEKLWLYSVMALRNGVVIAALEHYSMTTVLFPLAIAVACVIAVGMIMYRRGVDRAF